MQSKLAEKKLWSPRFFLILYAAGGYLAPVPLTNDSHYFGELAHHIFLRETQIAWYLAVLHTFGFEDWGTRE